MEGEKGGGEEEEGGEGKGREVSEGGEMEEEGGMSKIEADTAMES